MKKYLLSNCFSVSVGTLYDNKTRQSIKDYLSSPSCVAEITAEGEDWINGTVLQRLRPWLYTRYPLGGQSQRWFSRVSVRMKPWVYPYPGGVGPRSHVGQYQRSSICVSVWIFDLDQRRSIRESIFISIAFRSKSARALDIWTHLHQEIIV